MKFDGTAEPSAEHRTRDAVARLLMEAGPQTASALAERLDISPAAVRRHLDALVADEVVVARDSRPLGGRRRGRPARVFALTEGGRESFPHAYDDLAASALRFLAARGGEKAVAAFAEQRLAVLESRHRDRIGAADTPGEKVAALSEALTAEGYAASAHTVGSGEQLCQHHCPVAHVAAEFPQLCEAETQAFSRLLGTHVQRLATIARGDGVCTTHVPLTTSSTAGPTGTPVSGRKHA